MKTTWTCLFFGIFVAVTARGVDWAARVGQIIRRVGNAHLMMMMTVTMMMMMTAMSMVMMVMMKMMTEQPELVRSS